MSDPEDLEQASRIAEEVVEEEKRRQTEGISITDVPGDILGGAFDLAESVFEGVTEAGGDVLQGIADVGGTALQGIAQVGGAVAEHAGDAASAAVDVAVAVIGGLLDS